MLVDITDRIVIAKAQSANQFIEYIDYFHLVRTNGDWVIVNQLSYSKLGDRVMLSSRLIV